MSPPRSAVNLIYRTAYIFSVKRTWNIASISTNLPLSCICRLVLILGSPINTFLPEYSGALPSSFSIVRREYWKPVLTSFPHQHTRVALLSFERRTRENRSTNLRKIASRQRVHPQSPNGGSVAKHSAADVRHFFSRIYRPSREDVLYCSKGRQILSAGSAK